MDTEYDKEKPTTGRVKRLRGHKGGPAPLRVPDPPPSVTEPGLPVYLQKLPKDLFPKGSTDITDSIEMRNSPNPLEKSGRATRVVTFKDAKGKPHQYVVVADTLYDTEGRAVDRSTIKESEQSNYARRLMLLEEGGDLGTVDFQMAFKPDGSKAPSLPEAYNPNKVRTYMKKLRSQLGTSADPKQVYEGALDICAPISASDVDSSISPAKVRQDRLESTTERIRLQQEVAKLQKDFPSLSVPDAYKYARNILAAQAPPITDKERGTAKDQLLDFMVNPVEKNDNIELDHDDAAAFARTRGLIDDNGATDQGVKAVRRQNIIMPLVYERAGKKIPSKYKQPDHRL